MTPEELEVVEAVRGFYRRVLADGVEVPTLSLMLLTDSGGWQSIAAGIRETADARGLSVDAVRREWETMKATAAGRLGRPG